MEAEPRCLYSAFGSAFPVWLCRLLAINGDSDNANKNYKDFLRFFDNTLLYTAVIGDIII